MCDFLEIESTNSEFVSEQISYGNGAAACTSYMEDIYNIAINLKEYAERTPPFAEEKFAKFKAECIRFFGKWASGRLIFKCLDDSE
jgi:hypothetical protein